MKSIQFFREQSPRFQFTHSEFISEWLAQLIKKHQKKCGTIVFIFTNDEYLRNINQTFLQHDYYTDIITFDYTENTTLHGEIYISIDRVKENAATMNETFKAELYRVLAHGILHLCGFKDKSKKEELEMRQEENKALVLLEKLLQQRK